MIIVVSVENSTDRLKGFLSRYMMEVSTGLYAAKTTRRAADSLREKVRSEIKDGRAVVITNANTDIGFSVEKHNIINSPDNCELTDFW